MGARTPILPLALAVWVFLLPTASHRQSMWRSHPVGALHVEILWPRVHSSAKCMAAVHDHTFFHSRSLCTSSMHSVPLSAFAMNGRRNPAHQLWAAATKRIIAPDQGLLGPVELGQEVQVFALRWLCGWE